MIKWKQKVHILEIIIVYVVLLQLTGIHCPIKFLTGISCPGCGITRACWSALHFRFSEALHYHPLFWLLVPTFLIVVFRNPQKENSKWFYRYIIFVIAATFIVYLIRLLNNSLIVTINLSDGLIYKGMTCFYDFITQGGKLWNR